MGKQLEALSIIFYRAQTHGDVRLGDPVYKFNNTIVSARVEIYWNGRWGTIHYNTNGDTSYEGGQAAAGEAFCKQLGFAFAIDTDVVGLQM